MGQAYLFATSLFAAALLIAVPAVAGDPGLDDPARGEPGDGNLAALLDDAAGRLAAGRLDQTRQLIDRAVELAGRPAAFRGLVERLIASGHRSEALALALGTAGAWLREGASTEAASLLEPLATTALEQPLAPAATGPADPVSTAGRARLHALYGEALAKSERHPSAIPHLERALDLGRQELDSRFYLAAALWEVGRYDDAETHYRAGLEASGGALPWRHQLARLLLWQGRADEAATLLEAAARQRPAAADLQLDLAWALERGGRVDDAAAAYRRAIELAPELAKAHYGLAQLLLREDRSETARPHLEIFQRLYRAGRERARREGLETARLEQGRDLLRHGRYREAIDHFRALGESVGALRGLARAQRADGDLAAAAATLERAVTLAPDDPQLRRELAAARLATEALPTGDGR